MTNPELFTKLMELHKECMNSKRFSEAYVLAHLAAVVGMRDVSEKAKQLYEQSHKQAVAQLLAATPVTGSIQ